MDWDEGPGMRIERVNLGQGYVVELYDDDGTLVDMAGFLHEEGSKVTVRHARDGDGWRIWLDIARG